MRVGFTGTRAGLTPEQRVQLSVLLRLLNARDPITAFHHGNCVGADEDAAVLAKEAGLWVVSHPCDLPDLQSTVTATVNDEVREVRRPLVRNRFIVDETDVLIATPGQTTERFRSSETWSTIRYSRLRQRPRWLIFPDGTVTPETASATTVDG